MVGDDLTPGRIRGELIQEFVRAPPRQRESPESAASHERLLEH